MRPHILAACAVLCATASFGTAAILQAQNFATHPCGDKSDDHSMISHFFGGDEQICEVRSTTFALDSGHLKVKSMNGGIDVIGEDRQDIALEARVSVHAGNNSEAADILHHITIQTGGTVEAHGPKTSSGRNWAVSYKLHVPHHLAAELSSMNGALSLSAVNGSIRGETTNGGLSFDRLAGDVHLSTTNGGIRATLDGSTWQGPGLEATTTNGGVTVSVPAHYSAHLVAETTNGGASVDVPGADQNGVHRHSIDTNLGSGGPTLHFETTNGGITIH
jgi:DUF4097 and DUF4098 domain-containing protein YvlB